MGMSHEFVQERLFKPFDTTKGSVKFPLDVPLPECVVEALISARKIELGRAR